MQLIPNTDPLLHRPSKLVSTDMFENNGIEIKSHAAILIESIQKYNALGISACQLGIDLAMFVMITEDAVRLCINPQIVAASVDMEIGNEGCLSFPGLTLKVKRPSGVVVRYLNLDGNEITEKLEGLDSRVWLHEYDHINGVCFVDRVSKLSLDMAKKRQIKLSKRKKM